MPPPCVVFDPHVNIQAVLDSTEQNPLIELGGQNPDSTPFEAFNQEKISIDFGQFNALASNVNRQVRIRANTSRKECLPLRQVLKSCAKKLHDISDGKNLPDMKNWHVSQLRQKTDKTATFYFESTVLWHGKTIRSHDSSPRSRADVQELLRSLQDSVSEEPAQAGNDPVQVPPIETQGAPQPHSSQDVGSEANGRGLYPVHPLPIAVGCSGIPDTSATAPQPPIISESTSWSPSSSDHSRPYYEEYMSELWDYYETVGNVSSDFEFPPLGLLEDGFPDSNIHDTSPQPGHSQQHPPSDSEYYSLPPPA